MFWRNRLGLSLEEPFMEMGFYSVGIKKSTEVLKHEHGNLGEENCFPSTYLRFIG